MAAENANYWWQYDESNASMLHMGTGEQVILRGEVDLRCRLLPGQEPARLAAAGHNSGWYRFDYIFEDLRYPLLVGMGPFAYPTPDQQRHLYMPEGEYRPGPRMDGWIWIVDHDRSAQVWRRESATKSLPDYTLWSHADEAIVATALLWRGERWKPRWQYPRRKEGPALEIALRGGWLNGAWRRDLRRRFGTDENLFGMDSSTISPLSAQTQPTPKASAGSWQQIFPDDLPNDGWMLQGEDGKTTAKITLIEKAQGDSVRISRTDNTTGITTVSFPGLGTLSRTFTIDIPRGAETALLQMHPRSMVRNPKYSFDGIGEPLFPFGADWKIDLARLSRDQITVALDLYLNGLVPLVSGELGSFASPTLSPRCIALSGIPIAGRNCGILMAALSGSLPRDKLRYGWSAAFFE